MTKEQFYLSAKQKHENGVSWKDLILEFYQNFNELLTIEAIRKRVKRAAVRIDIANYSTKQSNGGEYEQYNADGSIEATKTILCNITTFNGDRKRILKYLGYDDSQWELVSWRASQWDGGTDGAPRYSLQYKVKPKTDFSINDAVKAAKKAFSEDLTPFLFPPVATSMELDNNKLMEVAPVELHIGKMSNQIETGENYDLKIAQKRFYDIFEAIYKKQLKEQCGHCVIVIGSDFFNSESDNCTSKDKIPQQNDTRYIKLFYEGIKMYTKAILTLRNLFNKVDIMLCAGNHARAMETFLYMALEQRFVGDDVIHFIENYRLTQVYQFGKCAIFYNHGDANLKQTIKSIPAEFPEVWGTHPFRELHLGHLHKEVTVDDEGGMITRRIGSPCSTDAWHYGNRFIGAVKKHQIFIWDAKEGLEEIYYINTKQSN